MGGRSRKSFFKIYFFVVSVSAEGSGKVPEIRGHPRERAKSSKTENVHQILTFLKTDSKKIDFKIEFSKSPRAYFEASHKLPRNQKSRSSDSICDFQPIKSEHNGFRLPREAKINCVSLINAPPNEKMEPFHQL